MTSGFRLGRRAVVPVLPETPQVPGRPIRRPTGSCSAQRSGQDQHQRQDRSTDHANLLLSSSWRRFDGLPLAVSVMMRPWTTTSSSTPAAAPAWSASASTSSTGRIRRPYGERRAPSAGREADLRFDRDGGWCGPAAQARHGTAGPARIGGSRLRAATDRRRAGRALPGARRDAALARSERVDARTVERPRPVLNLFAYTGLATLALARAGAAVAHVDAARPAVAWARRNAALNGLADRPIRWLVDDAACFRRARDPARAALRRHRPRPADLRARRVRPRLAARGRPRTAPRRRAAALLVPRRVRAPDRPHRALGDRRSAMLGAWLSTVRRRHRGRRPAVSTRRPARASSWAAFARWERRMMTAMSVP